MILALIVVCVLAATYWLGYREGERNTREIPNGLREPTWKIGRREP